MNQQQVNIKILHDDIFIFLLATNSSNAPFNDESLYGTFGGLYFKRRVKNKFIRFYYRFAIVFNIES